MAKAVTAILIITMLLLLPLFSFQGSAEYINGGGVPTPGTYEIYSPCFKYVAGTNYTEDYIQFIDNDAYESGLVNEPYHFLASVWANYNNQRVVISFFLAYAHVYAGQVDIGKNARFVFYQDEGWVGTGLWKGNSTIHYYNVSAGWSQLAPAPAGSADNANGYYSNTSFLTSSSDFYPGVFAVDVYVYVNHGSSGGYQKVATIYGLFTSGTADVKDIHDASHYTPGVQPYTSLTVAFGEGEWNVTLWFGATTPPVYVAHGKVNTTQNPDARVVKYFGEFSDTTLTLRYNFTSSDPHGVYVWIITSKYKDVLLTSYSWTVYNNAQTTQNGTIHEPEVVAVKPEGTFTQGLTVHFYITVKGFNTTNVKVWIIAWFGNNKIAMPDPSTDLVVTYWKPYITTNGGTIDYTQTLKFYGNFNINIFTMDDNGNLNVTRVQYYVSPPSGGGWQWLPSWFTFPWSDTTHLILLAAGLALIFLFRNNVLKLIGLSLFILAFIDFHYLAVQLNNLVSYTPKLQLWRWRR